jgi:V/A-type H+-transporting ATPase subunit I
MAKTFVAAAERDRESLLEALGRIGVLHLTPVDPARALPDPETAAAIHGLDAALGVLARIEPHGAAPQGDALEAAAEVLALEREAAERRARLAALAREMERLAVWGDLRLESLGRLTAAGVRLRWVSIPREDVARLEAACVSVLGNLDGGRALVALADREGGAALPESAQELSLPARDRHAVSTEAAEIDARLREVSRRLATLAGLAPAIRATRRRLDGRLADGVAVRGGLAAGPLFALQGWVPAERAPRLGSELAACGLDVAVRSVPPSPEETPPTLVRPPRWATPILGLFEILGLAPGYREIDVSPGFMVALPLFAAMLISDAGYGLLFALVPLVLRRRMIAAVGHDVTRLTLVIGCAAVAWGLATGSVFGVDVARTVLAREPLVPMDLGEESRDRLMLLSFFIGALHLSLAQLWRATSLFPSLEFLARVGWAVFLWGMFGVVRHFVLGDPLQGGSPYLWLLAAGGALAVLFTAPSRNVLKMVALGLANFPLSMLGTFSDIMSYVRLIAVGLAGSVLASQFNALAQSAGPVLRVPVLVFGHALNLGLCVIALFAHGVRLNVLEFSNNVGMQWAGYTYRPYVRTEGRDDDGR